MLFDAEQRRFPAIDGVTLSALALFRPGVELPFVGIGSVTILAIGKRNLFLKVILDVAGGTSDADMLSGQRILGLGMIEVVAGQQRLPASCRVAGVAGFLEFTAVRIDVTIVAFAKLHVLVTDGPARGVSLMALVAGNLDVQAGQRIAGLGVVKFLANHFPGFDGVALGAFVAELTLVGVLVAGRACGGLAEEGLRRILVLDQLPEVRKHVAGSVAFLACEIGMLAFELVACQAMIKFLF